MFFTKGGLCSLPRGRSYVQLEKKLSTIGKNKKLKKRGYVQLQK